MKDKKDKEKTIKALAQDLLEKMAIKATVETSPDQENQSILVNIDAGEDNALLVGYHGRNLTALQTILGLMATKKIGEWTRISVDVGQYREERKNKLENMAEAWAEKAIANNEPVIVSHLEANERRIVHLFLKDHPEVKTYSEGEGRERHLIISPQKKGKN